LIAESDRGRTPPLILQSSFTGAFVVVAVDTNIQSSLNNPICHLRSSIFNSGLTMRRINVRRTLSSLVFLLIVFVALPAFAQATGGGAGKLELSLFPAGWLSFTEGGDLGEASFGQYMFGGSLTVNWSLIGIEGDLFMAPGRTQDVHLLGGPTVTRSTPHVVHDSVSAVFPLMGNAGPAIPFVTAGIGEVTIMRTSDDLFQPDTETFTTGSFGGGLKWHRGARWGFRGDYRYTIVRSKFASPGSFFGEEQRRAHRFYAGLIYNLIQ
jgi:hypothetical protein